MRRRLKKFEELSPEIYRSAGNKLGMLGFPKRKKALHDHISDNNVSKECIYELTPGNFYRLANEYVSINSKIYKDGDESFYNDKSLVIEKKYAFELGNSENKSINEIRITITFQIIINFNTCTCSVSKNYCDISIGKRAGYLIKKNILPKMFDTMPFLSEVLMINEIGSGLYVKIIDSIENINLNYLCSDRNFNLIRNYDFIEDKLDIKRVGGNAQINELNDETYSNAYGKLMKKGHFDRAMNIKNYLKDKNISRDVLGDDEYIIKSGYLTPKNTVYKLSDIKNTINGITIDSSEDSVELDTDDRLYYKIYFSFPAKNTGDRYLKNLNFIVNISLFRFSDPSNYNLEIKLDTLEFDRRSALKFKRKEFDRILTDSPLSEVLMLKEVDINICSKIFEVIDSITVNDINAEAKEYTIFDKTYRNGKWQ